MTLPPISVHIQTRCTTPRTPSADSRVRDIALRSFALLAIVYTICCCTSVAAQIPQGDEFRLNTPTAGSQSAPRLTRLNDGNIFGAWDSPDGDSSGVFANIFNPNGTPRENEFAINQVTTRQQTISSLSTLLNGDVVTTWSDTRSAPGNFEVYAAVFSPTATLQTSDTLISTIAPSLRAGTAPLSTGNVAAVWQSLNSGNNSWDVRGRILNDNVGGVGSEFAVTTFLPRDQENPSIGSFFNLNGGFVVAWDSELQDPDMTRGVYARFFNDNGMPTSGEFRVHNQTAGAQERPAVATFPDSTRFVIAYESNGPGGDLKEILAQYFYKNGTKLGPELRVNTEIASIQDRPTIAAINNDLVVIGWQSSAPSGNLSEIKAQMLDGSGNSVGREFQVNNYTISYQQSSQVIRLSDSEFMFAWMSDAQGGPAWEVFGRLFNTTVVPIVTTGTTATTGSTGTTATTRAIQTTGTTAFVNPTSTTAAPTASAGSSPAKADLTWLWVILGVTGFIAVGGGGTYLVLRSRNHRTPVEVDYDGSSGTEEIVVQGDSDEIGHYHNTQLPQS